MLQKMEVFKKFWKFISCNLAFLSLKLEIVKYKLFCKGKNTFIH